MNEAIEDSLHRKEGGVADHAAQGTAIELVLSSRGRRNAKITKVLVGMLLLLFYIWRTLDVGFLNILFWEYAIPIALPCLGYCVWVLWFAKVEKASTGAAKTDVRRSAPELSPQPVDQFGTPAAQMSTEDWQVLYGFAARFVGVIVFFASWIYCIATYGYLLGVGLGWLPSIIVALVAALLWPLIVIAGLYILVTFQIL